MSDEVQIKNERILLREIESSDLEHVFRGLSHPQVIKHYGVHFKSLEETEEQMKWFSDPKQSWFAICSLDNLEFLGAGGLNDISRTHKKAEIGLWLLPDYWGQGLMQEAIPLICDYGFDQLGLHRIEGFVESDNENCKRALSKLNFELEGTMKDCEIKDGKYISVNVYSMINRRV